ncbi:MAG: hypothetical protein ACI8QD_001721 [Cyclobacteriaceae bacterium]|jgi:hypothetical protein
MKNNVFTFAIIATLIISACQPDIAPPLRTFAEQRILDIQEINDFLSDNGFSDPDTTASGARYFTFFDGEDTVPTIKKNDIVTFDYTAYFMDSSVFLTTVPFVADTANIDTLESPTFTYSETGWSLRYVPIAAQYINGPNSATGFSEAIATSFKQMVPGDRVVILLPSDQATTNLNISVARVIFYEITVKTIDPR